MQSGVRNFAAAIGRLDGITERLPFTIDLAPGTLYSGIPFDRIRWGSDAGVPNTANISGDSVGSIRPTASPHYSVATEVQLKPGTYTASDANHFRQANRKLYNMMQENPSLAARFETQYPGITAHVTPGPRGGVADTLPPGLTWHHDPKIPGQLQLLPRSHHQAPGPVQNTLHPQQQGGREIWGGGR